MANAFTLQEFATEKMLTVLLVKERAKCRKNNRSANRIAKDKKHNRNHKKIHLDRDCDINTLTRRKMLSRMMPPRHTWVRPSKRKKLPNKAVDTSKNTEKALLLTIERDRELCKTTGKQFAYLQDLDKFIQQIKKRLDDGHIQFERPLLVPILKDKTTGNDGVTCVTCRPLAVYTQLEDKIIISVTSRYLTRLLDQHLHENILSYRPPRHFHGQEHYVTTNNDGIALIKDFRDKHVDKDIYVADCDIKKFYDSIPHSVVIECFDRILDKTKLTSDGKAQVMSVLKAYLDSYNFYTNALIESQVAPRQCFHKVRRRMKDQNDENNYRIEWVDEILALPEEEKASRGVPQGGALSLIIANVVLNDVDQFFVANKDDNRLFIRYCDDMILMHTSREECERLMNAYTTSLTNHGLFYHDFEHVSQLKEQELTTKSFWKAKSHHTFKWDYGSGESNSYIGFLGYEMRRDGKMRLRKSKVKHFKEKLNRIYYAIRRYQKSKKHSEKEKEQYRQKTLDQLLDGVNFYKSLDLDTFKQGRQYKFFTKLRHRVEARLERLSPPS